MNPDFTGFQAAIKDAPFSWSLPEGQIYYFNYNSEYHQQLVFAQNFTTDDELSIQATLGFDFVINDMMMYLRDVENNQEYYVLGEHKGNFVRLLADVPAGTYTLKIFTGYTQYSIGATDWYFFLLFLVYKFSNRCLFVFEGSHGAWSIPCLSALRPLRTNPNAGKHHQFLQISTRLLS